MNNNTMKQYDYPFRIYIEDTDAGGIVYHANHLKFMERARREWLRDQGLTHYSARDDYQFVVHTANLTYIAPILMDDLITVTIYPKKIGFASLDLQQNIYRGEIHQLSDAEKKRCLVTQGEIKLACVNKQLKPAKMPADLLALFS